MDTLQCAIVLAKLERFAWELERRVIVAERYNQLMDEAGIRRVQQRPDRTSVFAQYTILIENREARQKQLKDAGVPTAVHYPVSLNEQPAYMHLCRSGDTPVARQMARLVMSVPMGPDLDAETQSVVLRALVDMAPTE